MDPPPKGVKDLLHEPMMGSRRGVAAAPLNVDLPPEGVMDLLHDPMMGSRRGVRVAFLHVDPPPEASRTCCTTP